jgi:DNA-binding NtrC family response regulator
MIQLLIADPDTAMSKALCLLIQREMPFIQVTEVRDVAGLIRALTETFPNVLLLDWNLYGSPALDMYRLLQKAHPHLKVILMSVDANQASASRSVHADFVNKCVSPAEWTILLHEFICPD